MTGRQIGDRLIAEAERNLAIIVLSATSETYEVQGRGELQLGEFSCYDIFIMYEFDVIM